MTQKGLSMTMTMVILGVILLLTALTVITMSGSQLSQYFNVIGLEQGTASSCHDVAQQAQAYCNSYIPHQENINWSDDDGDGKYDTEDNFKVPESGDECVSKSDVRGQRQPGLSPAEKFKDSENIEWGEEGPEDGFEETGLIKNGYEVTATEKNCKWTDDGGLDPVVVVEGEEKNCIEQGKIRGPRCPVN